MLDLGGCPGGAFGLVVGRVRGRFVHVILLCLEGQYKGTRHKQEMAFTGQCSKVLTHSYYSRVFLDLSPL